MSGNYAVLVDAGFLMAEGARALGLPRDGLAFDGAACVEWCSGFYLEHRTARAGSIFAGREFLRAYWYDGAYDPVDRRYFRQRETFDAMASVAGLYLRLGHLQERRPAWQRAVRRALRAGGMSLDDFAVHFEFRPELEQKGVDVLMTLDMVILSLERTVEAILLVSGDRDLEEAVRFAQGVGCRVVVAHPRTAGVATSLCQLADARFSIEETDLQRMLVPVRRPAAAA
jgi:uncharacterized LabA/DUF88 family protein